ncbi:MAG: cysteine desulfurase, partial [Clostridiales bacterium]|nr:cysteine desulfurase [Clostridiales bacterium]
MERVYLDHAATTPPFEQVVDAMADFLRYHYGNPSSLHSFGSEAKTYLGQARQDVAELINAAPEEIFFTSGGTEADNIAILGSFAKTPKKHLITSAVEHHAVLDTCEYLHGQGFEVTVLPVDEFGMVQPHILEQALRDDTFLVSIMHANNEVGTVNPIGELVQLAHAAGALFHVDAVQSVGKIEVDVAKLGVDMLTYSAHKINGPKGVGALYKRKGLELQRQIHGGGQEGKLRSGTENLSGIVGFGVAAAITRANWLKEAEFLCSLRDAFVKDVLQKIPDSRLNGHPTQRLPHNANLSFNYIEGEALLLHLDMQGIAASAGSACSSGTQAPSHVLKAMN